MIPIIDTINANAVNTTMTVSYVVIAHHLRFSNFLKTSENVNFEGLRTFVLRPRIITYRIRLFHLRLYHITYFQTTVYKDNLILLFKIKTYDYMFHIHVFHRFSLFILTKFYIFVVYMNLRVNKDIITYIIAFSKSDSISYIRFQQFTFPVYITSHI